MFQTVPLTVRRLTTQTALDGGGSLSWHGSRTDRETSYCSSVGVFSVIIHWCPMLIVVGHECSPRRATQGSAKLARR